MSDEMMLLYTYRRLVVLRRKIYYRRYVTNYDNERMVIEHGC